MRKIHLFFLLILFFTTSCCDDPEEIGRYSLSQSQLDLIPYELADTIRFQHSNGYDFNMSVTENTITWEEEHPFCESPCCNQGFFSYQSKTTVLNSVYPSFNIKFSIIANVPFNNLSHVSISLNYDYFSTLPYDSSSNFTCDYPIICHDSLVLNQRTFYQVIETDLTSYQTVDSTSNRPKSILYNKQFGLLQIKTTTNETYTIK